MALAAASATHDFEIFVFMIFFLVCGMLSAEIPASLGELPYTEWGRFARRLHSPARICQRKAKVNGVRLACL
jgi:hypothetical protein